MQFLKVAHTLITDTNITSNEFRIYTYLMMLYNDKNNCSFPSMETIADKIGISKRTVVTSIKNLEELEYIKVEKQKAKIGNYNKYNEFKHLVPNEETEVKTIKKKISKKKEQIEKKEVLNEQVTVEEAIEYVEKVKILTPKEKRKQVNINSKPVKIARSYTDIDTSKFAIDVISCLDENLVREACNSFKKKLESGKLKKNVATNLVKECIDVYCKNEIEIPKKAFNLYKKVDNLLLQPTEAKELRMLKETSEEYFERINIELGIAL